MEFHFEFSRATKGMVTPLQWVGSASDAGKTRPTYYYHYHEKFSPEEKINKVVNWLKLPEKNVVRTLFHCIFQK